MRRESHPELMLFILSMAVLWLEAKINVTLHLSSQKLPWYEARAYCQKNYIDMVTWDIIDKDGLTKWLHERNLHEVWIGLHEDPEQPFVWRWINVKTGEGLTGGVVYDGNYGFLSSCGSYNSVKEMWESTFCFQNLPFVCFSDNLVLVKQNKTWEEALNHCKEMTNASYKYNLLSFTNSSEYDYVSDRIYGASNDEVWTGLRFLGGEWWWSDGETLDHQEMLPDCPSQWRHCGTVSKNATTDWTTRDCSEKRNFICVYEEVAEQEEKKDLSSNELD